jgi:aminopeptidase N
MQHSKGQIGSRPIDSFVASLEIIRLSQLPFPIVRLAREWIANSFPLRFPSTGKYLAAKGQHMSRQKGGWVVGAVKGYSSMKSVQSVRKFGRGPRLVATLVSFALITAAVVRGQEKPNVFGNPSVSRWAPSRTFHVDNYKLTLHFDELAGEVFGDEVVTLEPLGSNFTKFYLDSSELKIDSVRLESMRNTPVKLAFAVDEPRVWVTLDRAYDRSSKLNVRIVYHGFPRIGLFFVNPDSDYPNRPREIFTQGEPEFNHSWFPCWDFPNDLATSETITTVREGQTVVSNGKLVNVSHSADKVTYDWVESIPHSSYLVSLAIGPWHRISDQYKGTPVDYYVPRDVDEATARRSFHLTPDMIGFFSSATGVEYPYEQYAQTAVHNFAFGGQENVSATTLSDVILHDERADADYPSTGVVSHELGQHWFGDYVQGRDWANIWLNEGFATWLETLYLQHHESYDAYRLEVHDDQEAEQAEGRESYLRPIVDRNYTDPLQMFDATTHAKGAAVLDMLRFVIDGRAGMSQPASQNERLFQVLHRYLETHRTQAVDTADLISTIRNTSGEELDWFFHEWVAMAGHPDYRVRAGYDSSAKIERLTVTQAQKVDDKVPLFDMPVELVFYGSDGQHIETQVRDHLQEQEFDIPLDFEPQWVDFDPDDFLDKTIQFDKTLEALAAQAEKDPSMMSRLSAVEQIGGLTHADDNERASVLARALNSDRFYAVRAAAASSLGAIGTDRSRTVLLSQLSQPDSRVRTAIVKALGNFSREPAVYQTLVDRLHNDASYAVQALAARELGKSGVTGAFEVLQEEVGKNPELHVMAGTLRGLVATRDPRAAAILLALSRPGVPERTRLSALSGLAGLKEAVKREHPQDLVDVVRAAVQDQFLPIHETGEQLIGAFDLTQFQKDVQVEAQSATMIQDREAAERILEQLKHSQ